MTHLNKTSFSSLKIFYAKSIGKNCTKAIAIFGYILLCSLGWQVNAQTLSEGFEDWTDTLDTYVPNGWNAAVIVSNSDNSTLANVSRVPALNEGQYALQITNDGVFGIEGLADNQISFPFNYPGALVDIKFSAKCEGEGICEFLMSPEASYWNVEAGGNELYTVVLENILISGRFGATSLLFRANSKPISGLGPAYDGVSFLTIDDLQISSSIEPGSCNTTNPLTMPWLTEIIENTNNCVGDVRQFEYNNLTYFVISPNYNCPPEIRPNYFACDGGLVCSQSMDGVNYCTQNFVTASINNGNTIWSSNNPCENPIQLELVQNAMQNDCVAAIYTFDYQNETYVYVDQQCEAADGSDVLYNCNTDISCYYGGFTYTNENCKTLFEAIEEKLNEENILWSPNSCNYEYRGVVKADDNNGFIIELDNGMNIRPINTQFEFYNNQYVELSYVEHPFYNYNNATNALVICIRAVENNTNLFEKYTWLNNIINLEACSTGTTITAYNHNESYTFIYISWPDGNADLYFQDGTFYCSDAPLYACLDLYNLTEPINSFTCESIINNNLIVNLGSLTCTADDRFTIEVSATGAVNGKYGIYNTYGEGLPDFILFEEGETIVYEGNVADATNGVYLVYVYDRDIADGATQIIEINIADCITESGNALFEKYTWLNNLINTDNCDLGNKVTEYDLGSYSFLFVEDNNGGKLYFEDGTFYCADAPGYNCRSLYGFNTPTASWTCENTSETCSIENPLSLPWVQNLIAKSAENYIDVISIFKYEGSDYIRVAAGSVLIDGSSVATYNCNGTLLCTSSIWYENIYVESAIDVCRASANNSETIWEANNSNEIFGKYPWLNTLVNQNNCVGTSVTVYSYGTYNFISIESNGSKNLYFQDGTFYCTDAPNYNCAALYGLNEATSEWNCEGIVQKQANPSTQQKIAFDVDFKTYPNPSNGQFTVELAESSTTSRVNIVSTNGRLIKTIHIEPNQKQIAVDLTAVPNGIYNIQLQNKTNTKTKKMLIR